MAKDTKVANNGDERKEPLVCSPARRSFYEQNHNSHRFVVPVKTTRADLEGADFLSACRKHVAGGDQAHVFTEDWRRYWQALAVGGTGRGTIEGGDVRLVVLLGPIELPEMSDDSARDLPAGYRLTFDQSTRAFVPIWESPQGEVRLNSDGYPRREDARRAVLHHATQAASVQRSQ